MKKVLSILLALVMVLSMFQVMPFAISAEEVDNVETGKNADLTSVSASVIRPYPVSDDDYPAEYRNPALGTVEDRWHFWNRNCTSFCAWRLNSRNGIAFNNTYKGIEWNNAYNWGYAASNVGITVNKTPAVGSIAWWNWGHVAWVQSIRSDGTVIIEEYNSTWLGIQEESGRYLSRGIIPDDPTGYIHIKDIDPTPHTHNYNTYVYYTKSHPHYNCYKCSCGEVKQNTNEPNYISDCADCNHTVSYNANGGYNAPTNQTKRYLSKLYLSGSTPTRQNYEFLGWSTDSSATTAAYQPGAIYNTDKDLTLYAVWKLSSYTVKFDANGGTKAPNEQYVRVGDDYTLPTAIPSRDYHLFLGWSPYSSLSGDIHFQFPAGYTLSSGEVSALVNADKEIKLYALWKDPIVIEANNKVAYQLQNRGDVVYYAFQPSESGCYIIERSSKSRGVLKYSDGENTYETSTNTDTLLRVEAGKTYYFTAVNYDTEAVSGDFTLISSDIDSAKIEATKPVSLLSDSITLSFSDFDPIVTLYNKNKAVIFKGTATELAESFNLELFSKTQKVESAGDYTFTIKIGNNSNVTCNMKATVIGKRIVSIKAEPKEDIELLVGCHHCIPQYSPFEETLDKINLTFCYEDGTNTTVDVSSLRDKSYNQYWEYKGKAITVKPENTEIKAGKNNVVLSFSGLQTTYAVTCIDGPIEKITVLSAPSFYEDEYVVYASSYKYYDVTKILNDQNIKLKVFYKDKTSKTMIIDSPEEKQYMLGDNTHWLDITTNEFSWDVNGDNNYIKINYLGYDVDVYVDIMQREPDELIDFEMIQPPENFDVNHYDYNGYPELKGATMKLYFKSGKTHEGKITSSTLYGGTIEVDKQSYQFNYYYSPEHDIIVMCNNIKKTIINKCPKEIVAVDIIGDISNTRLKNTLFRIKYSDGKTVYTKSDDYDRYWGRLRLDTGFYFPYTAEQEENLSYSYSTYNDVKMNYENTALLKAKAIAYNIGKNGNVADGYNFSKRTKKDINSLIDTIHGFVGNATITSSFEYKHPNNTIPYEVAYRYLNQYYGLTKSDLYLSDYYNDEYDLITFESYPSTVYLGFDESVQLYSETQNSYIIKYTDEKKTQYFEISKDSKLIKITGTAPTVEKMYNIIMTDGYSDKAQAQSGSTITICANVPKGKQFVKWTSGNKNVKFKDESSCATEFTMVGANVTITPVFKDDPQFAKKILGDIDSDGEVTVIDVTLIQRYCALVALSIDEDSLMNADVDFSGDIDIFDVTFCQRYLAGIATPYAIGEFY